MGLVYTNQKSKLSKKQRAAREALLKEQRAIKRELKQSKGDYVAPKIFHRETPKYPSLAPSSNASTAKKERLVYSGDYLVGIATMHKSNLVPVGREDDPVSYSTMRRS